MYCGALPIRRAASPGDFDRRVATTFIVGMMKIVGGVCVSIFLAHRNG